MTIAFDAELLDVERAADLAKAGALAEAVEACDRVALAPPRLSDLVGHPTAGAVRGLAALALGLGRPLLVVALVGHRAGHAAVGLLCLPVALGLLDVLVHALALLGEPLGVRVGLVALLLVALHAWSLPLRRDGETDRGLIRRRPRRAACREAPTARTRARAPRPRQTPAARRRLPPAISSRPASTTAVIGLTLGHRLDPAAQQVHRHVDRSDEEDEEGGRLHQRAGLHRAEAQRDRRRPT